MDLKHSYLMPEHQGKPEGISMTPQLLRHPEWIQQIVKARRFLV
jgi:hypothetical protein